MTSLKVMPLKTHQSKHGGYSTEIYKISLIKPNFTTKHEHYICTRTLFSIAKLCPLRCKSRSIKCLIRIEQRSMFVHERRPTDTLLYIGDTFAQH